MDERGRELKERLKRYGQEDVLRFWDRLNVDQKAALQQQIESIDLAEIRRLFESYQASRVETSDSSSQDECSVDPPSQVLCLPQSAEERETWANAALAGEELLRAGRVGVILVAGGQGTRLGFPHAKGMFPIGPVSECSLFQMFVEQVLARSRHSGAAIPYYIMTSDATHEETVKFFTDNAFFGLPEEDVAFFRQGNMPAVDDETGQLLLAEQDRLCMSPDGHGGLLQALRKAGLLEDMARRGIDYLFYHQVDNPAVVLCDPAFLGFHAQHQADVSVKVLRKEEPVEKLGLVVSVGGVMRVIEYSDLPHEMACQTDESGQLRFWTGSPAIHVFSRAFFERLLHDELALSFHFAHKAVAHLDDSGELVKPDAANAVKFERFIFDALPHAETALIVEGDRRREFHPVKNKKVAEDTPDTPERTQQALLAIWKDWLVAAGAECSDDAVVEISPLFALDADDVRSRIPAGSIFSGNTYLRA